MCKNRKGKGVCGKFWKENRSIIVDNVDLFEGHIACNLRPNQKLLFLLEISLMK